jgi:hypothetical protein
MVLVLALLMFATARASHEHAPRHGITSLERIYDVARYPGHAEQSVHVSDRGMESRIRWGLENAAV